MLVLALGKNQRLGLRRSVKGKDIKGDAVLEVWPLCRWIYFTGTLLENPLLLSALASFRHDTFCPTQNQGKEQFECIIRVSLDIRRVVIAALPAPQNFFTTAVFGRVPNFEV